MSELMAQLRDLQKLDSALQQRRQWIAELDDGRKSRRKFSEAVRAYEACKQALEELEATARRKDLDLKSAEAERQEKSKKAYGGTIADGKELAALERKIEELKRRAGGLEEELLKLMEQVEAARTAAEEARTLARKLKAHTQAVERDYAEVKGKFDGEMAELQVQREALAAQVDGNALREYDALRAKMEGLAVAEIQGDVCAGCRNVVPGSLVSRVKMGREIVKCQNCRRILCLPG